MKDISGHLRSSIQDARVSRCQFSQASWPKTISGITSRALKLALGRYRRGLPVDFSAVVAEQRRRQRQNGDQGEPEFAVGVHGACLHWAAFTRSTPCAGTHCLRKRQIGRTRTTSSPWLPWSRAHANLFRDFAAPNSILLGQTAHGNGFQVRQHRRLQRTPQTLGQVGGQVDRLMLASNSLGAIAINGQHNLGHADRVTTVTQGEAASRTFGGRNQAPPPKFGDDLFQVGQGHVVSA